MIDRNRGGCVCLYWRSIQDLGILPIDITISSKIALFVFFMIDSITNYNILFRRD